MSTARKPKDETKTLEPQQSAPVVQQQIRIAALKSWTTGVLNEAGLPILSLESFEGQGINVHMSPEVAIEIGEALLRTGQQTKKK